MIWFFYNLIFGIVFILLLPKFLLHMRRRGGYWEDFWQRIGRYDAHTKARLAEGGWFWIHGVSVGEAIVALKFIEQYRAKKPQAKFVLTTTTSTGHKLAKERSDRRDIVLYFPIDCPFLMRRILKTMQPIALAMIETELWPNVIRAAHAMGVPVFMINGRMSDSSYRGYSRLKFLTKRILPVFDKIFVQSEPDRDRYLELGAPETKLIVAGTAKYETAEKLQSNTDAGREILRKVGCQSKRTILLGASTWPGEEDVLLDFYRGIRQSQPDVFLVLAPRHAERRAEVLQSVAKMDMQAVTRQQTLSSSAELPSAPDLLLVDTTGELSLLYPHAEIVFVGKSLCKHGGQNPIEPAVCGKAVVVGPNMENFRVVVQDMLEMNAIVQVSSADELKQSLASLLSDREQRRELGQNAIDVVRAKSGAMRRTVELISTE